MEGEDLALDVLRLSLELDVQLVDIMLEALVFDGLELLSQSRFEQAQLFSEGHSFHLLSYYHLFEFRIQVLFPEFLFGKMQLKSSFELEDLLDTFFQILLQVHNGIPVDPAFGNRLFEFASYLSNQLLLSLGKLLVQFSPLRCAVSFELSYSSFQGLVSTAQAFLSLLDLRHELVLSFLCAMLFLLRSRGRMIELFISIPHGKGLFDRLFTGRVLLIIEHFIIK